MSSTSTLPYLTFFLPENVVFYFIMLREQRYSFLENNRFSRESSYNEKQLRELFNQGRIDRETELWLWDEGNSRLAGTYESLFIRNRRFKERRLGIFGAKNSGKTTFLDCCTKFGKNSDDDPASKPLRHEISIVEFPLLDDGMAWEIRTLDYFDGSDDWDDFQSAKIHEWIADADAVLLLIDGSETADCTAARSEEIRLFLDQLRRRSPEGNRIDKPIAVVWTKADLYENLPQQRKIRELIETFVPPDSVKEFSVSIYQPNGYQPDEIIKPILWAVRKNDEMMYEKIVQSGEISKREILNECRKLRDVWGINRGELGKKIDTEIGNLQREFRLRLIFFVVAVNFGVFAFLFLAAIFVRNYIETADTQRYRTALADIEQAENRKEIEAVLENYRNKFFSTKKHFKKLETPAQKKIQCIAVRQTESAFQAAKYAIEHAETPEKIDDAIEKFRNKGRTSAPEHFVDELTMLATKKRQDVQFGAAADWERNSYENFHQQAKLARTANDLKKAEELAQQYLLDADKRTALRFPNQHKADVEAWKAWFDDLKREQPLGMIVKEITVPKSFFKGKNLEGKITITLQLGKTRKSMTIQQLDEEQKKSNPIRFYVDLKCSIDNAVWDEQKRTKISLSIAEYLEGWRYFGFPASKAVCEVADSEYPYIEFCPKPDGVFTFNADQTTITVTTRTE